MLCLGKGSILMEWEVQIRQYINRFTTNTRDSLFADRITYRQTECNYLGKQSLLFMNKLFF